MTGKERVLRALGHSAPERTPLDFWATEETIEKLLTRLRVPDEESLLRELSIDIRTVTPRYLGDRWRGKPYSGDEYTDIWGVRRKRILYNGGSYWEVVEHPLGSISSPDEIRERPLPDPSAYDFEGAMRMAEGFSEYAVVLFPDRLNRTSVLKQASYMRGFEVFLSDLVLNPELAGGIVSVLRDYYLRHNEFLFRWCAGVADIFMMGDDFGAQNGLIISLDMWREFFREPLREFIEQAHSYGLFVMFHSCGDIRELIPELIEIGVDILNPIQRTGRMIPGELKRDFGDRISFHGAIDIQHLLPLGSEDEVREETRRTISELGRDGGYILCPCHNIQPDTPVENILALYDEARSFIPGQSS